MRVRVDLLRAEPLVTVTEQPRHVVEAGQPFDPPALVSVRHRQRAGDDDFDAREAARPVPGRPMSANDRTRAESARKPNRWKISGSPLTSEWSALDFTSHGFPVISRARSRWPGNVRICSANREPSRASAFSAANSGSRWEP